MSETAHTPTDWTPTEQINPDTRDIDLIPTAVILEKINAQDALIAAAVKQTIPDIAVVVDKVVEAFLQGGRLFYFGAGTSGRLGVLDASECPPTYGADPAMVQGLIAGGDTALRTAVEGAEDSETLGVDDVTKAGVTERDAVVGLSASGGAPYVVGAVVAARKLGAFTAAVTCHGGSALAKAVDRAIVAEVGPEVIAGSSRMKAGTAQKMILNMITTTAMVQIGKTYENLMVDLQPKNEKLRLRARRIVSSLAGVSETNAEALLTETGYQVKPAVLMGRLGIAISDAETLLAEHQGKLRAALGVTTG